MGRANDFYRAFFVESRVKLASYGRSANDENLKLRVVEILFCKKRVAEEFGLRTAAIDDK